MLQKFVMTNGDVHYTNAEQFQSSTFDGAPRSEETASGYKNADAGEPSFRMELINFIDIEGNPQSLNVLHVVSLTQVVPVTPAEAPKSDLVIPTNIPDAALRT